MTSKPNSKHLQLGFITIAVFLLVFWGGLYFIGGLPLIAKTIAILAAGCIITAAYLGFQEIYNGKNSA